MAAMPRKKLARCQTSRGLRDWLTVRPKRNRIDSCLDIDWNQVSFLLICWVWITRGWRCQGEVLAARCIWSVRMYIWTRITAISTGGYMLVRHSVIHAKTSMLSIFLSYFCFWRNVYWMCMYISLFRHHNLFIDFS